MHKRVITSIFCIIAAITAMAYTEKPDNNKTSEYNAESQLQPLLTPLLLLENDGIPDSNSSITIRSRAKNSPVLETETKPESAHVVLSKARTLAEVLGDRISIIDENLFTSK